jgi:hypothetical protein
VKFKLKTLILLNNFLHKNEYEKAKGAVNPKLCNKRVLALRNSTLTMYDSSIYKAKYLLSFSSYALFKK